jgi:hypothetical protein
MRTLRLLPALLTVLMCSSCVPILSIYPLWDEHNSADLPGLAGTWTETDGTTIVFVKGKSAEYNLTYTSNDGSGRYVAHPVTMNGRFFLDLYPDEEALEKQLGADVFPALIPAHFFARIALKGDALELNLLDDEAVEKEAKEGGPPIPLLKRDDGVVLIAETKTLQTLIDRFAGDPALWGETGHFTRKPQ